MNPFGTRTQLRDLPATPATLQPPAGVRELSEDDLRLVEGGMARRACGSTTGGGGPVYGEDDFSGD